MTNLDQRQTGEEQPELLKELSQIGARVTLGGTTHNTELYER